MEQELIKLAMIKWAQDLNENIYLEEWKSAWRTNVKKDLNDLHPY